MTKSIIFQVDNLIIKIVFQTEQYYPLVFGGVQGNIDNIEIILRPFIWKGQVWKIIWFHSKYNNKSYVICAICFISVLNQQLRFSQMRGFYYFHMRVQSFSFHNARHIHNIYEWNYTFYIPSHKTNILKLKHIIIHDSLRLITTIQTCV